MYAFGDEQVVALESVNVLEELLVDYITDIVRYRALYMRHA